MGYMSGYDEPAVIDAAEPRAESRDRLTVQVNVLHKQLCEDAREAGRFAGRVLTATTLEEAKARARAFLGLTPLF